MNDIYIYIYILANHVWLFPGFSRLDDQIFLNRNQNVATVVRFHPYIYHLAVSDKDSVTIWDWEQYTKLGTFHNQNPKHTHITAMEFVNAHDNALLLTGSGQ